MEKCKTQDCQERAVARGLCMRHYKQFQRHGKVTKIYINEGCKIDGCSSTHHSKGFCRKHYNQYYRGRINEQGEPLIKNT